MMYPVRSAQNPWKSYEQAAANAEPAPEVGTTHGFWAGRFGAIFAAVVVAVTIVAIALAAVAPTLGVYPGNTPPAGFAQVYTASLSDDGKWVNTGPCAFTSQGLDVTGSTDGVACVFQPSTSGDLTSQGFWLQTTVAPSAFIRGNEEPLILIGDSQAILFSQQGSYAVYCQNSAVPCAAGLTTAWHTNAFVSNTITVSYDAGASTLTVFANAQQVVQVSFVVGGQATLALGAGSNGEALFTRVSIYAAQQ